MLLHNRAVRFLFASDIEGTSKNSTLAEVTVLCSVICHKISSHRVYYACEIFLHKTQREIIHITQNKIMSRAMPSLRAGACLL